MEHKYTEPLAAGLDRELLRAVFETAVDGIVTIDGAGTVLSANPAVERIFGYPADELIGRNVKVLMPTPYHEEHDSYLANYNAGGVRKIIGIGREVQGRRRDGSVFPMGGALDLAQSDARGSTFHGNLKASIDSPKPTPSRSLSGQGIELTRGAILYIEDNLSNLKLVRMILEDWPRVELIPALQGQIGLELAASLQPDIILLDLHLPDINGVEVLRRLKADPATATIPVVMISADATAGQIERLLAVGAHEYLTKPIEVAKFLTVLQLLLKQAESSHA